MFGPRMLQYSSDGPKLHLDSEAFAFSKIRVVLGSSAGEWDYVTLEDPDGERGAWEWAKECEVLQFRVGRAGRYKLRYLIDGGYITVGTVVETLDIDVRSPVRSFVVDRHVDADAQINVRWELEFVPPGCMFVFRRDRIRLAERAVSTRTGTATIPAPRAAGEFSFTLQGTNSRDSQMAEEPVTITCSRPFSVQLRHVGAPDDAPQNAMIAAPGAELEVVWGGELIEGVDSIVISPSEHGGMAHVLFSLRCDHAPDAQSGRRLLSAPRHVGLYSVVYGVRYNSVTIPAALAHLAVSDRIAPPSEWLPLAPPAADDMTLMLSGSSAEAVSSEFEEEGRREGGRGGERGRGDAPALAQVLQSLLLPMLTGPALVDELYTSSQRHRRIQGSEIGGGSEHASASISHVIEPDEEEEAGAAAGRREDEGAGGAGQSLDGGGGAGAGAAGAGAAGAVGAGAAGAVGAAVGAAVGGGGGRGGAEGGVGGGGGRGWQPEMLCVVCLDSSVSVLIRPCNHVVLCARCSKSLKLCPMDRRPIEARERVFLCQ